MKRLSGILTDLKMKHGFELDYLVEVIEGFSSKKINEMTFIHLLDRDLMSIMQKYFPNDDLSIFWVV
jgi:hypothetical protein